MPRFHAQTSAIRRNLQTVVFVACVLASVLGLGWVFAVRGEAIMEQQLKEKLRETAAIAALQFDAEELQAVVKANNMQSAAFADIVRRLHAIERASPYIEHAYIMQKTPDPNLLSFIADSDSLATVEELDTNLSGSIDEDERGSYLGDTYDVTDLPAMRDEAFSRPSVDEEATVDQWGEWMSGYAPIQDNNGRTVAILGIDMAATEFKAVAKSTFTPILLLLTSVAGLLLGGYAIAYMWQRKQEDVRRLDEERTGILRLTSHQLGELLTIFQWSLEDLGNANAPEDDRKQAYTNIDTGVRRMKHILGVLRSAAKLEAGEFPYKPEPAYIRGVMMDALRVLAPEAQKKQQKISLEADGNLQMPIDTNLIGEVLKELLSNAIDFSRPQSTIVVTAQRKHGKALVQIRDEGCGISQKDLSRIFGKFVRGSNAHLSRPDGYGLGLFMARRVIDRAGGDIWIESDEGKGTTVSFTLPL